MTDSLVTDNVPPLARRSAADSDCIMALEARTRLSFCRGNPPMTSRIRSPGTPASQRFAIRKAEYSQTCWW